MQAGLEATPVAAELFLTGCMAIIYDHFEFHINVSEIAAF